MIAQWENECIPLSVLSVFRVQFPTVAEYISRDFSLVDHQHKKCLTNFIRAQVTAATPNWNLIKGPSVCCILLLQGYSSWWISGWVYLTQRFPGCVIRRLSACTRVPHRELNSMVEPPLFNVGLQSWWGWCEKQTLSKQWHMTYVTELN